MKKKNRSKSVRIPGYIQILSLVSKGASIKREVGIWENYSNMESACKYEHEAKEMAAQKRLRKQQKAAACLKA